MQVTSPINEIIERFNDQYFYGEKVGVYLIKLTDTIILFDLPTYSEEIDRYLGSFKKPILSILSHGSCGIEDGTIWQNKHNIKIYLNELDKNSDWLRIKPDVLYKDIPYLHETLEIIPTPGHSPGSICLLEKTTQSLCTGDTCAGTHTQQIRNFRLENPRDDLKQRFESCKKLLNYNFVNILPFHYEMILGKAKIQLESFTTQS